MRIYRGQLHLLDYVFYATVERGKMYETGAFIHNYALTYALQLVRNVPYAHQRQEPHYVEELSSLNGSVYITPGAPQTISHRLIQWNTIREGYGFPGKSPSLGYPDWGFARVLRPDSRFRFYMLLADIASADEFPTLLELFATKSVYIRLGKFMGKARIHLEEATKVTSQAGEFVTRTMLNWRDIPADPLVCDIVATALPTRLINNAFFADGPHYQARFGEEIVNLPADMHFLARLPDKKRL